MSLQDALTETKARPRRTLLERIRDDMSDDDRKTFDAAIADEEHVSSRQLSDALRKSGYHVSPTSIVNWRRALR